MTSYSTTDLCDAYPDLVRVAEPIFTNFGGKSYFGGEIVTVKCFEDNSMVKNLAGAPGNGRVMVVDGGGSRRRALLGDLIAQSAEKNGWEGIIIYGSIRDVDAIAQMNLGVKALGAIPLKTERRGMGDINVAISFAGVSFSPGEFVYSDGNGIIVSPKPLAMPD
ncbi:MAG: ribonuclease E activity regulator RraA [Deltaproteobacteria bacterium]